MKKTITEAVVYKKIKNAGWMLRVFAILVYIFVCIATLLSLFDSSVSLFWRLLFILILLIVGLGIHHYANQLCKMKRPIKTVKIYLMVFTILLLPLSYGLLGLIMGGILWLIVLLFTVPALLAIKNSNLPR